MFTMKWKIPLYKIFTDNKDEIAISKVIRRGMSWAIGPEIEHFEVLLAKYLNRKFCVVFNSGTSALHASLLSLDIKSNDEVIVPSFTFIATVNSVLMVNAKPKFVDIEEETLGLNPNLLESAITSKTKAIIPIHYAGLPCKIDEIQKISKKYNIPIVEDTAESFGSKIKNKKVGTFGDLSILSFAGNKVLTTGEGGAVLTNSKLLYEKLKLIRSHGRKDLSNYFLSSDSPNYVSLGYNWRMSSITAALGISQLKKLDKLISLRQKKAKFYQQKLKNIDEIQLPAIPLNFTHVFQLYSIILSTGKIRNDLKNYLSKKGIMTKTFFDPIHETAFYKKNFKQKIFLPKTVDISKRILSLPLYPTMTKEELNYVCNSVLEFFNKL
jgi:perosamine synthetase